MKRIGRQKAVTEMTNVTPINVDFVEAGSVGPVVMLVHSSVSGARQWRRLMEDLKDRFRVRAVNLFGYGNRHGRPKQHSRWTIKHVSSKPRCRPIPARFISSVTHFGCHEGCGAIVRPRREIGPA
jgi:pimeloyl-ACP methyl ester carboxylesterase